MVFRSKIMNLASAGFLIFVLFIIFSGHSFAASTEISGLLKVDAEFIDEFDGTSSSDIVINRAEVHLDSELSEWITTHISLLYRQNDDPLRAVDLEIDNAYIEYGNAFLSSFSAQFGQLYVPFGSFDTNMASNPLTRVIGETREVSFVATYDSGFNATLYMFNGDLMEAGGEDSIDNVGVNLGYVYEGQSTYIDIGFGYLNNFGETDFLSKIILQNQTGQSEVTEYVPGMIAHLIFNWGSFQFIGELAAATKEFAVGEIYLNRKSQPSATNIEMAYNFGKSWNIALGMQSSVDLSGYLPETRVMFATSYKIDESTRITFEYAADSDYASNEPNGTGESGSSILLQLAAKF